MSPKFRKLAYAASGFAWAWCKNFRSLNREAASKTIGGEGEAFHETLVFSSLTPEDVVEYAPTLPIQ